MFYNFNMLQYRLKYETVRTQMPFQNNNFLFNLFSLLSIFNSTFSLSLTHVLSLFLLQITLPHPQINGTAASSIKPPITDQAALTDQSAVLTDQAAAIASRLKTPSPPI